MLSKLSLGLILLTFKLKRNKHKKNPLRGPNYLEVNERYTTSINLCVIQQIVEKKE